MPWVHTTKPPHTCRKPLRSDVSRAGFHKGSVWQCDDCERQWRVVRLDYSSITWDEVPDDFRIQGAIPMPGGEPAPAPAPAPKQPWYKRRIF